MAGLRLGLIVATVIAALFATSGTSLGDRRFERHGPEYSAARADSELPGHAPSRETAARGFGQRAVLGLDERIQVSNTEEFPWSTMTYLALYDEEGNEFAGCSGTFIGPDVVLTAAHCLWQKDFGGFVWDIAVIPGRDAGYFPYDYVWAQTWIVPQAWLDSDGADTYYDWGIIKLADGSLGNETGWLTAAFLQAGTLAASDFQPTIVGYPGDKPEGTMWAGLKDNFAAVDPYYLEYTVDTAEGQSGSSIFSADTDSPYLGTVVGVHAYGGDSVNSGRRLNMDLLLGIIDICIEDGCDPDILLERSGLQDGGFEQGTPSSNWSEDSSNFGTVICAEADCGGEAHSGEDFVWFGGVSDGQEDGYLAQQLEIPDGTTTLSFWLQIPAAAGTGDDYVAVELDGEFLFSATDADAGTYASYRQVDLDISKWGDGDRHRLTIYSTTFGEGETTNFYIDDLALGTGPIGTPTEPPPTPTEPPPTPTVTATATPGASAELFEGWNPLDNWPGPRLESEDPGDDEIGDYLTANMDPPVWQTLALYQGGMWLQRFEDAPLPSFQTLDLVRPGDDLWIFVVDSAVLSFD